MMFRHDIMNFLSKTTVRRIWNMTKVFSSFYVTRLTGRKVQWGMPITVSIEPTTACNLRCPECPSGLRSFTRPTGNLQKDFFRSTIDEIAGDLSYLIFYFQGEPYIHPDFLEMVNYAHHKGLYTITSTNGHFLNDDNARKTIESGLDRLIISIDGTTQETYESYRKKGQLSKVLKGAEKIIHWKKVLKSKKPHVVFQFLVVRPNEHQIPEVYRLAQSIGVDEVRLKTAQLYDFENGHPLMPENNNYSRYYKKRDGSYAIKSNLENHCWKLWHACVITWDGKVVPCCFDKDATHRLGDLKQSSFKHIWKDTPYESFRRRILKGRKEIDICANCTEGCNVWVSS